MVTYAVNITNVQEVAGEMAKISAMMNDMIEQLNNQQALNLNDWIGNTKDAYFSAQAVWNNAAKDMANQALVAQGSLGSITDAYANAEYQGLGLWGQ